MSCSSAAAGSAPACLCTSFPSLNAINVGIDEMLASAAKARSACVSTVPKTMSGCLAAAARYTGANMRHGPHHSAQKSTNTMLLSVTASAKVFACSVTVLSTSAMIFSKDEVGCITYSNNIHNIEDRKSVV